MHFSTATLITSFLVTTIVTSALSQASYLGTFYGISISANTAAMISPPPVFETIPVEINVLTETPDLTAVSELFFVNGSAINVDLSTVECRAYKDADGVVPGSAPFTWEQPAELSTNTVAVGSILCYIVKA